jgi:fructokinase
MKHRILSVGEVLWDVLPTGSVMGGAAANFAVHARAMGAFSQIVSRVGDDGLGHEILRRLQAMGVDTGFIEIDRTRPTSTVSVTLSGDGQPSYTIHENVAWDAIGASSEVRRAASKADAVCFGTLTQRTAAARASVQKIVASSPMDALRVFDINLRQAFYSRETIETSLNLANALKLNETELPVLAEMFCLRGDDKFKIAVLAERFQLRVVAFTRGADGSSLMVDGEWSEHGGVPAVVRDTVGAGDAFTAALVVGLLDRWPLPAIHQRASEVASFVCSSTGPTPTLPERFLISSRQSVNSSISP